MFKSFEPAEEIMQENLCRILFPVKRQIAYKSLDKLIPIKTSHHILLKIFPLASFLFQSLLTPRLYFSKKSTQVTLYSILKLHFYLNFRGKL